MIRRAVWGEVLLRCYRPISGAQKPMMNPKKTDFEKNTGVKIEQKSEKK